MSELFPGVRSEIFDHDGVRIVFRRTGEGPPLLLLHGFPQTHAIWHRIAPLLASRFSLVMPDLRGYGDSSKPVTSTDHAPYSKRVMAGDVSALMQALGHGRYFVCGHDRGGRVSHRLALDQADAVRRLMVLDIAPTRTMYQRTTMEFARLYYHWFFLIQPAPLPETLIGADPALYLRVKLGAWGAGGIGNFDERALAEYVRCFTPPAIHAMCEDYRASAGIDLEHDRADEAQRIRCPVHALWGARGVIERLFTPLADWQAKAAATVTGRALPCGHYIPEELPEVLASEIIAFFGAT
ncbi:MAG TPA: alpha/beta hydrolase [Burkholderiaceae bacterium]|nr:alpha/beta hydrolase [Burkholderiaceae bacterium]